VPTTWAVEAPTAQVPPRPEFFRLPKQGQPAQPARNGEPAKPARPPECDPFFGFSRSFYYELDKRFLAERGEGLLIHIRGQGKKRGVTLIPYAKVAAFVRSQMEAQING
jgi:hypothetical protein